MVTATPTDEALLQTLKATYGYDSFRPLQHEIVRKVAAGRDVMVLMPTGGGKSLCYQLPALLNDGVTIVVSPLIALMKDQVDSLRKRGVQATFINSSLDLEEVNRRLEDMAAGRYRLVYVAPERLLLPGFLRMLGRVNLAGFAIDEAHCISEWGHDFRPEYRGLGRLRDLFPGVPLGAYTATATERVQQDIRRQLGLDDAPLFHGSFNRPNLFYEVRPKRDAYGQLLLFLHSRPGASGIIYCGSRNGTEELAQKLRIDGFKAEAYHAGLAPDQRRSRQERFVRDDVPIIVATIAFGMGIDKPDVRFVVHFDLPKTLEGYYQESGRAGRDGEASDCILFYSRGDMMRYMRYADERETPEERAIAMRQLQAMTNWAEATSCRRTELLRYFGEEFAGQEGQCCDVCRAPTQEEDVTVAAQMFLSCVKRTDERFGVTHVIDVLRGSKSEKVQRLRHDQLSTHGIGKDRSVDEWRHLAGELIRRGYLSQDPERYNVLKLQPPALDVLFRGARVSVPRPRQVVERKAAAEMGAVHVDLFERLRALRKRVADEQGVPPYLVLGDVALRQMAAALPRNRADLLGISGVGHYKADAYGATFLSEIGQYIEETGAQPLAVESAAPPRRRTKGELGSSRRESLAMHRRGLSIEDIASARMLASSTIAGHLADCIEAGEAVDITTLVDPARQARIELALQRQGGATLSALRETLGDEFPFNEIRIVRAYTERRRQAGDSDT